MKKTFSCGQVLSIAGERLLCDMDGIHDILNHMTQDNLFTHQLIRAHRECAPWLKRWFPELLEYDDSEVDHENWQTMLIEFEIRYGKTFEVDTIPRDDHPYKDPIEELAEMRGGSHGIIEVDV